MSTCYTYVKNQSILNEIDKMSSQKSPTFTYDRVDSVKQTDEMT